VTYGILPPCRRCVYAKSREVAIILTGYTKESIKAKCIVNLDGKTYARRGDCLGYILCGACLEKVLDKNSHPELPCSWIEI